MEKGSRAPVNHRELKPTKLNSYQKKWETACAPPLENYYSERWMTPHLEQLATNFLKGEKKGGMGGCVVETMDYLDTTEP